MVEENIQTDLLYYMEMGDLYASLGKEQEALDYYLKGLNRSKDQHDTFQVDQFSRMILAYL